MTQKYDVIIIGGGPIGLATAYYLAQKQPQQKIAVLEQYDFLNQHAGSNGESRQFRIQYNQKFISELVLASMPLWQELQQHSQEALFKKVGCLWFGDPEAVGPEAQISKVLKVMDALKMPYETLSKAQIEDRYHFKNLPGNVEGFVQPDGSTMNVKAILKVLLQLTQQNPQITLLANHQVIDIDASTPITVKTTQGTYVSDKLVINNGPFINDVLKMLGFQLKTSIWEMVSACFKKTDPTINYPTWINYQKKEGDNPGFYYGFPDTVWDHPGYIRVAPSYPVRFLKNMAEYSEIPNDQVLQWTSEWVQKHMQGLDPKPQFATTGVCAFMTENGDPMGMTREFVIGFAPDNIPNHQNIVIQATGWAFKLTPLLGKICADLALDGKTSYAIEDLAIH
jgi:glycine/D-amino acid oxidase-like deaminating enzyme